MTEPTGRDQHQRWTFMLAAVVLGGVLAVTIAAVTAAKLLNQYGFLYFPLGFYLAAQGLLIGITAAGFWFAAMQDRIDRTREESQEL